jgi:hypothetical protein
MVAGIIGMVASVGAPLTYALVVRSPSKKNMASLHATTHSGSSNYAVSNKKKVEPPQPPVTAPVVVGSADCTSPKGRHPSLASAHSSQLKKLSQYEQVCGSGIISQASFFALTPTTDQEAREDARDIVVQLREFSANGISPLVFLEPTTNSGSINLAEYRAGKYDTVLDTYFAAIKAAQITDQMMGTWVSMPEANLPEWSSVDPSDFAANVTKTVTYQKKYFPASKASIMLDTITYPNANNWDGGKAVSFLPYVQDIPVGLIDSFGLQGFPWSPAANEHGPTNGSARDYLRVDLAAEAARSLHVQDIWLNTGSFNTMYANKASQRVAASPMQRLAQLTDALNQAKVLQSQGFTVSIHLFAQDKSRVSEAIDWSYWTSGHADSSASTAVFQTFVHNLQANNIPLGLFDADD